MLIDETIKAKLERKYPEDPGNTIIRQYPHGRKVVGEVYRQYKNSEEANYVLRTLLDNSDVLTHMCMRFPSFVEPSGPVKNKVSVKHTPWDVQALRDKMKADREHASNNPKPNIHSPAEGNSKVWQAMKGGGMLRKNQNEFTKTKDPDTIEWRTKG